MSSQTKVGLILAVKTCRVALYGVSRPVLSPIVTRPAAQQQHRVLWVGSLCSHSNSSWGWGGLWQYKLWYNSTRSPVINVVLHLRGMACHVSMFWFRCGCSRRCYRWIQFVLSKRKFHKRNTTCCAQEEILQGVHNLWCPRANFTRGTQFVVPKKKFHLGNVICGAQ